MAAQATPMLEYGGFDYEFVETPPDRVLCKICKFPCKNAYMTLCCGHGFCKSCLDQQKKARNITYACPMCRTEEPDFKTVPYKALVRDIIELRVFCTNKQKGCEWQGELNNFNTHLNGCQFEEVKCSNECGKMIQRQYLTSHVETECPHRKVNCQYCYDTGEHHFIEGQHKEECPKLPLPCPNKCEFGSVPREDMEAHRKECPLEMIQCEYYSVGCEVRMARKDMANHNKANMDIHLMMMQNKLFEMPQLFQSIFENELIRTKNDLSTEFLSATRNQLTSTAATNCQTDLLTQDLATATTDELPSTNREATNESLISTSHPSTASDEPFEPRQSFSTDDELCAAVAEKDMTAQNKLTTQKQLVKISNEVSAIKEEMYAIKRLTEQTLDIQTKFISEVKSIQDKQHQKMSTFEATLQCVAQQVQLGPWDLRLRTNSANRISPMIIMIDNIDNKKRHNIKWLTDPFYTHDKMYKMCLHVIINGEGHCEGTHLSVFLYLMKGTHDARLQSSLMGNFVVTLLNQKTDDHHHSRRFTEMVPLVITNRVWQNEMAHAGIGCNDFISHEDLTNTSPTCQYLKDDCIFIKVEATVSSRNPQPKRCIINY